MMNAVEEWIEKHRDRLLAEARRRGVEGNEDDAIYTIAADMLDDVIDVWEGDKNIE